MRIIFTIILCSLLIGISKADDPKYINAMKKNITKIDSAKTVNDFLETANGFERIALAEKDKWLPYYYVSYNYTIASFIDTVKESKDSYLDKADLFINKADSLQPDKSEIYTLKGMIAQSRLQVDPMNRWMKYGNESKINFTKAVELDSLNPRPDYLVGVGLFYTPEQFGGGPNAAKPYFEKSLNKFEKFVPENELMPNWGRQMLEGMMKQYEIN